MIDILIDADPPVYSCGYAAEEHTYELIVADPEDELHQMHWNDGNLMKQWKAKYIGKEGWEFLDQTKLVRPLGVELAKNILQGKLHGIVKAVGDKYGDFGNIRLFLSGPGNFREELATIAGYKANRKEEAKPVYYQQLRNLMTEEWGAEVVHGQEADDAISIMAHNYPDFSSYVVASIDKDLDQIPGWHYNYDKEVFYFVEPEEAEMFFYEQALSGDSADNIPGCKGIGPVKAQKILKDCPLEDAWQIVVGTYEISMGKGAEYAGLSAEEAALETARLVRMRQYEEELWNPPAA